MRAVLTYHSIDDSGSPISIDEAAFARHVQWLASGKVRVTTLEELSSLPSSEEAVAITFDDGFANFADRAWPLLRRHGLPVTLFVTTDFVGRRNDWSSHGRSVPRLPLLDWDAIGRLMEEGVTVGSHSRTHPDLRTLTHAALTEEVEGAASKIQSETGRRPTLFAYPYGLFNDAAAAAVRAAYALACTTELRPLREQEDPARLPRIDTYYVRGSGSLEVWGTRRFQQYLWLRAGLRRLRSTLPIISHAERAIGGQGLRQKV